MDKNLIWKSLAVVIVVTVAMLNLYPPSETLKPGIDLAGGTSLIYEIDTTDLAPNEQRGLAQNMIPILLKRIDPTHVANIVMRPQGDTRIEIQLPVASAETREKREAYEQALLALEQENINLLKIRHTLTLPEAQRQEKFGEFARDSEQRRAILERLAEIYDQRKQAQDRRDALINEMQALQPKLETLELPFDTLKSTVASWAKQTNEARQDAIEAYVQSTITDKQVDEGKLS